MTRGATRWPGLAAATLTLGLAACGGGGTGAGAAQAVVARSGGLEVIHPWVPAPASPDVAALYLTLRNTTGTPDTLTGVSSPAATSASLHVDNPDGTMSAVGPLTVPAGAGVTLAPGHFHIMLEHLTGTLHQGQTITVALHFAHAAPVTVPVPILATDAAVNGMGGM